jgi:hypothetical protein
VRARVAVGTLVATLVLGLALVAVPGRAEAHPSALDALTVDLLLDQSGLVVVDAATNRASYEQAPTPAERAVIAGRVGEALAIPPGAVQLDDDSSTLYHEVGFRMSLHTPFSNALPAGAVQVDTAPLQEIAAEFGRLVLDVCGVDALGIQVEVTSSTPASPPDPSSAGASGIDRTECRTWNLGVDDPPVNITARATVHGPAAPAAREHVVLLCGEPTFGDPTFVDAGAIARSSKTMQAHATGPASAGLVEADTLIEFTTRTRVDLVVPKAAIGHLSFGSRVVGARATRRLRVPNCKYDEARPWTISRVTFWVDAAGCLPVIVKTPDSVRTVRFPVGAPCDADPQ